MKYLFFFNGQPLLLCCVCCKIAIQDFLTGLHKKNKKNLRFHRRTITRRYFTERCKKITGLCHNDRQVYRRSYRRTIPTESPTDWRTSRSACMSDTCPSAQIPTESPTALRTSRSAHMCDTCPSARIPTDRKVWRDFQTFFCAFQLISDEITDGI